MKLNNLQVYDNTCGKEKNGSENVRIRLKNHKLAVTCLCIDSKNRHAYTGSKDGSVIKWSIGEQKILAKISSTNKKDYESSEEIRKNHHLRHINCIAISPDDKFLATGGWDKNIRIWCPEKLNWIHSFTMHKQEITALVFRRGHPTLYSGSADRSIMLWTLEDPDNLSFIEALYGHESQVTSLDALRKERILSSGGRDQTVRIWKIVEQAQTVFECQHESVDIAKYIDDKTFITGGEDGNLSVWTTMKRSALFTMKDAHKPTKKFASDSCYYDRGGLAYWISALATFSLKQPKQGTGGTKKQKLDDGDVITHQFNDEDHDGDPEDQDSEDELEGNSFKREAIAWVASGSCNSEVKVWKLSKSKGEYKLTLHQSFECPGFVNDLSFTGDGSKLLAACGQEHKFGRWWKLPGSRNCLKIFDMTKK